MAFCESASPRESFDSGFLTLMSGYGRLYIYLDFDCLPGVLVQSGVICILYADPHMTPLKDATATTDDTIAALEETE